MGKEEEGGVIRGLAECQVSILILIISIDFGLEFQVVSIYFQSK